MYNKENSFIPIVGIDLGTTNSAIAYIKDGKPQILSFNNGEKLIPSVVLIDLDNNIVVGKDALDSLVAMPNRTVAGIKRNMGSDDLVHIADRQLFPHEISALILKELKKNVDNLWGEGEKEAVITVPAYFTDAQRRATKQSGELAGFIVERIINEPTAAALAYGLGNLKKNGNILVYDLGGGTFDVSVVEMTSGILEVKSSTGNNFLGGEDFDWKLVDWLSEKIIDEHKIDPRNDIRAKALLKREAESIKIRLSTEENIKVNIPVVTVKDNQPIGLNIIVYRQEFIKLIEESLKTTIDLTKTVLKDAELSPVDIDEILLVGGSTRIPRVSQLITELFGKKPKTDINPDEAVALGAAVQAGLKSGILSKSGLIATDVAPFSMGISVLKEWNSFSFKPGGFAVIIPKNTTIPVTRSEQFTTVYNGQTAVSIEVYQGEHEWVHNNYKLGEFLLEGIPPNDEGLEMIEVKFRYNINGILEVHARCISNEKEMIITIQDALDRNSQKSFDDSIEKIESLYNEIYEDEDDIDWKEILDLEDIEMEEEKTWEELKEEAKLQIANLNNLKDSMDIKQQKKAERLIQSLKIEIEDQNVNSVISKIEDIVDFIIDFQI